jgi:hypothetical protein
MMFVSCAMAWTEIMSVVRIDSVGDGAKLARFG